MLKYGSNNLTYSLELGRASEQQEAVFYREECVEQLSIVFRHEIFEKAVYESILVSPTELISLIDLHLLNSHRVKYIYIKFLKAILIWNYYLQVKISCIFLR